jgi:hyperosmotically inducible protein
MFKTTSTVCALALALGLGSACKDNDADAKTRADNTGINDRDRNERQRTADNADVDKSDVEIMADIRKRVVDDDSLSTNGHNVKIIAEDGRVILKGPVDSATEKARIEDLANEVVGRKNVVNQIEVAP